MIRAIRALPDFTDIPISRPARAPHSTSSLRSLPINRGRSPSVDQSSHRELFQIVSRPELGHAPPLKFPAGPFNTLTL